MPAASVAGPTGSSDGTATNERARRKLPVTFTANVSRLSLSTYSPTRVASDRAPGAARPHEHERAEDERVDD